MSRILRLADSAESALLEIAISRAAFDRTAGLEVCREVMSVLRHVQEGIITHRIVGTREGVNIHAAFVLSCTVLYAIEGRAVNVVDIFGAGRDWQQSISPL